MSNPHPPPFSGPPAPTSQRSGCATALLVVIGVLLMLPGICVLIIASFDPKEVLKDTGTLFAIGLFLLIAAGGIALIRHAVRRQR